mgnify:CR=1 FL=1
MRLPIILGDEAEADLDEAAAWYALRREGLDSEFLLCVENAFERVRRSPLLAAEESELQRYRDDAIQMLCIAGLSDFPQISLPMASRLGAPLGISLLGPRGADRSLIALAEKAF